MSFELQIQADAGEVLNNLHPEGKPSGGKAVFAFLTGLLSYCDWQDDGCPEEGRDLYNAWYEALERSAGVDFRVDCRALLDCMWGDGGDPTEFQEDEYEFFRKRNMSAGFETTEAGFREMLRSSKEHWRPIGEVTQAVRILLNIFERGIAKPLEGFYEPEDSIPDFEALAANLDFLSKRRNERVRLNFY